MPRPAYTGFLAGRVLGDLTAEELAAEAARVADEKLAEAQKVGLSPFAIFMAGFTLLKLMGGLARGKKRS